MGVVERRRSIRSFEARDIPQPILESILQAGLWAPSPKNRQPWDFVVLHRGSLLNGLLDKICQAIRIAAAHSPDREDIPMALESMAVLRQAPIVVLVCYRPNTAPAHDDGVDWDLKASDLEVVELLSVGAAVENMLLKATEEGIGSLWCADILYGYRAMMEYLSLDSPVVSAICFGYPAQVPQFTSRDSLARRCVFLSEDS